MAMKKSVWDMILKVVIAVASALAGVCNFSIVLSFYNSADSGVWNLQNFKPIFQHRLRLKLNAISSVF